MKVYILLLAVCTPQFDTNQLDHICGLVSVTGKRPEFDPRLGLFWVKEIKGEIRLFHLPKTRSNSIMVLRLPGPSFFPINFNMYTLIYQIILIYPSRLVFIFIFMSLLNLTSFLRIP